RTEPEGNAVLSAEVTALTARSRAEAALRDSEARFRWLVESDIFGVTFSTFDGRIRYANDYFLSMVGYDRADLEAGRVRWDLLTPPNLRELAVLKKAEFRERG